MIIHVDRIYILLIFSFILAPLIGLIYMQQKFNKIDRITKNHFFKSNKEIRYRCALHKLSRFTPLQDRIRSWQFIYLYSDEATPQAKHVSLIFQIVIFSLSFSHFLSLSLSLSLSNKSKHTHTQTHTKAYIYIFINFLY